MNARDGLIGALLGVVGCVYAGPEPAATSPGNGGGGVQADGGSGGTTSRDGGGGDAGPEGAWENVTGNLAGKNVGCGNLLMMAAHPDVDLVFAALPTLGVWSFDADATKWSAMNQGPGAKPYNGGTSNALFDPRDPKHFWITVIYGDRGVFETFDGGDTFAPLGDIRHIDEVAVNLGATNDAPWVAGGHEDGQKMWLSMDRGVTWSDIGKGLPPVKSCTHPVVLDADTFLVGCSYNSEGIYRSTDRGQSWLQVSERGGTASAVRHPDGSIFWAGSEGALFVSRDEGLTWQQAGEKNVFGGFALGPLLLPDGRLAAVGTQAVVVSDDQGVTWKAATPPLPYGDVTGIIYAPSQRAFFIKHNDCNDLVLDDAVMRYDWDYEAN